MERCDPGMKIYNAETMEEQDVDWHRFFRVMMGLLAQHKFDKELVRRSFAELDALAVAYEAALERIQELEDQRTEIVQGVNRLANDLHEIDVYEVNHATYNDREDVLKAVDILKALHDEYIETVPDGVPVH